MGTMKRKAAKRKSSTGLSRWQRSIEFRMLANAALDKFNRTRHLRTRCGAHARSTGEPCKAIAMENGRCYVHGGKTPKGDGWHRPRWPDKNSPAAMRKMNAKLADRDRGHKKRERKRATMTAEERAEHDKWQRTHKPGSATQRAAARLRREQALDARALLEQSKRASSGIKHGAFEEPLPNDDGIETDDPHNFYPQDGVFG